MVRGRSRGSPASRARRSAMRRCNLPYCVESGRRTSLYMEGEHLPVCKTLSLLSPVRSLVASSNSSLVVSTSLQYPTATARKAQRESSFLIWTTDFLSARSRAKLVMPVLFSPEGSRMDPTVTLVSSSASRSW